MNINLRFVHLKPRCGLTLFLLVILAFGTTSCDLVFPKSGQNINKLIESYWGIDVSSPAQVSLAIMGSKLGNKEAYNGLTAYAHCRSEMYQERGDKLLGQGDTAGARLQYEQAITWGTTNTPHRAADKAAVYHGVANTYMKDANNSTTVPAQWPLLRAAGQNSLKAAQLEPNTATKAFYYRDAAFRLAAGGDKTTGKQAYDKAADLDPNNPSLEQLRNLYQK